MKKHILLPVMAGGVLLGAALQTLWVTNKPVTADQVWAAFDTYCLANAKEREAALKILIPFPAWAEGALVTPETGIIITFSKGNACTLQLEQPPLAGGVPNIATLVPGLAPRAGAFGLPEQPTETPNSENMQIWGHMRGPTGSLDRWGISIWELPTGGGDTAVTLQYFPIPSPDRM